jgi:hypothetical protein
MTVDIDQLLDEAVRAEGIPKVPFRALGSVLSARECLLENGVGEYRGNFLVDPVISTRSIRGEKRHCYA